MVCLRNISVDILHKGDTEDNNNNNNSDLDRNIIYGSNPKVTTAKYKKT
jgi:hypothetical protein